MPKEIKKHEQRDREGANVNHGDTKENSRRNLVETYLARVKNRPFVALLIVLGLAVIAIAQFTGAVQKVAGAVQKLLSLLPSREEQLPDLTISKVDLKNSKVHITNLGGKPVPTDELYLAWSEGWYTKPEWNNATLVGHIRYVDHRMIRPGESLPVVIKGLDKVDEDTEFMIDAGERIEESDESNNAVNVAGEIITPRRSLRDELLEMRIDDNGS